MRSAVSQAGQAYNQANNTANTLGGEAQGIGANLTPFLTQELTHPQGYSQQDQSAMLSAGLGGAGGESAGLGGAAQKQAAVTRNAGGFQAALDDAARQRMKGAAGSAEGIAAENANVRQMQQQDAAKGLQGMYGTDTSGMLDAMGHETGDINAEVNANNSGWFQNTVAMINAIANGAKGVAALKNG